MNLNYEFDMSLGLCRPLSALRSSAGSSASPVAKIHVYQLL